LLPEKYGADKVFKNPANNRTWLFATELFRTRPDGVEELSPQGKVLLNSNVAQMGESALVGPIVIEGYWAGTGEANPFLRARTRASLVSQYLQNHLQIEQGSLGVVSLLNTPSECRPLYMGWSLYRDSQPSMIVHVIPQFSSQPFLSCNESLDVGAP
jgi:hypothetical protein